jgi:gamma-glutamyl hercynylcysteine S-oxide synthase
VSAVGSAADDPFAIREANAELLSLALIDARNHTLRWLAAFRDRDALTPVVAARVAGVGQFQDRWIARHLQRHRGEDCDPEAPRLPPASSRIDAWLAGRDAAPAAEDLWPYLEQTLETTLDLLAAAPAGDAALHYYRLALRHEDRIGEALAEHAAETQLPDAAPRADAAAVPWRTLPARPPREPLWFPSQRLMLGSRLGGTVPEGERWAHEVLLPEFEIDAQPVGWNRYIEFAEDGGYDRRELWSEPGWAWLQAAGRRAPRHVEQLRGSALVQRRGRLQRVAENQPVLHVTRHEAEAWCRWAGRRLPTEPEWELAALAGASRGFAWGDVFEWAAGSARAWPGHEAGPGALDRVPAATGHGVLRGASWMTRPRERHPKARRFAPLEQDTMFCGFRSCTL